MTNSDGYSEVLQHTQTCMHTLLYDNIGSNSLVTSFIGSFAWPLNEAGKPGNEARLK